MKILHLCLSSFYIDNFDYQENILPRLNKLDGHEVQIIASTETFKDGKLSYLKPGRYVNEDGITVIRVAYSKQFPFLFMNKLRYYQRVYPLLEQFHPDVILFHGISAGELQTITKYVKNNKHVKFYIDTHASYFNSGKTFISMHILHKMFYKYYLSLSTPYVSKIFYIGIEEKQFIQQVYRISEDYLEFFPLGGIILRDNEYLSLRYQTRNNLHLKDNDIMFLHTGKIDKQKKTIELIRAFQMLEDDRFHMVIAGIFLDDVRSDILHLIEQDKRISFLGWKKPQELECLLCAADVYVQPGSVSATLQNAICNRCAVIVNDVEEYIPILKNNGYFVKNEQDMIYAFNEIHKNPDLLEIMKENSLKIATEILDYKKLAARLYI